MRTPKNRLQELAQNLHRRQAQKQSSGQGQQDNGKPYVEAKSFDHNQPINLHSSGQGQNRPRSQRGSVEAMAFDHNEPIELRYNNQEAGSYVPSSSTYAAAHSVAPDADFGSEAFEVEAFDAEPVATAYSMSLIPEVVPERSQPLPTKSATPPVQSSGTDTNPAPAFSAPKEVATADDFLEDLQAILKKEKTYDGSSKQVVDVSSQATQLSTPAPIPREPSTPTSALSTPPAPQELTKQASPHDVFDRLAQGIPPEPSPTNSPAPQATYSSAHSVFDRMGKNMAFANSFDLGTISLQQRFDEFDRVLDKEERSLDHTQTKMLSVDGSNNYGSSSENFLSQAQALTKDEEAITRKTVERYSFKNRDSHGIGWEGLKADYVGTEMMAKIAEYRKELVDQRLRKAIEATGQKGLVNFGDTGSSDPTSDYDVQLYDTGKLKGNPGLVIKKFYEDFRIEFGMESGTLFDTNIYDPSYRMPRPMVPEFDLIAQVESEVDEKDDTKHIQDAGAFAKIRKFMTQKEWKDYKEQLLTSLQGSSSELSTEKALTEAELLYDEYRKQLNQTLQEFDSHKQEFTNLQDKELRAKNELYVLHLEVVQQWREEQLKYLEEYSSVQTEKEKIEAWDKLVSATKKLKRSMVIATLWAHEAYHSEGPMADVVGIGQSAFKKAVKEEEKTIPLKAQKFFYGDEKQREDDPKYRKASLTRQGLTVWQQLWSANENFGDALKDIKHYSDSKSHPFEKTAIQTSKYVDRLLTIAESLIPEEVKKCKALKELNSQIYGQRKMPFDKALEELNSDFWRDFKESLALLADPISELADPISDKGKIEFYKKALTKLNLDINTRVREKLG